MPRYQTLKKKFTRVDVGSMNSRITINARQIQAPNYTDVNFNEVFTKKLDCWAMIETVNGKTIFDSTNTERILTHKFHIRNVPNVVITAEDWIAYNRTVPLVVQSITRVGAVATVTLVYTHNYTAGDSILISGATQTEYNGLQTIAITGAKTFTFAVVGTPVTPATGTIYSSKNNENYYDIIRVEDLGEEGRFLTLLANIRGDSSRKVNYA